MILEEIVADKKRRLPEHMARIPETEMRRMAEETKTREADCFYNHLKKPGLSIIGEFKKASPSLGTITSKIDLMERIATDPAFGMTLPELEALLEPSRYVGRAPEQTAEFLESEIAPMKEKYREDLGVQVEINV